MKTHEMKVQLCPACGYKLSAATGVTTPELPSEGDATVCAGCAAILEYGAGLAVRVISIEDIPDYNREIVRKIVARIQNRKSLQPAKIEPWRVN